MPTLEQWILKGTTLLLWLRCLSVHLLNSTVQGCIFWTVCRHWKFSQCVLLILLWPLKQYNLIKIKGGPTKIVLFLFFGMVWRDKRQEVPLCVRVRVVLGRFLFIYYSIFSWFSTWEDGNPKKYVAYKNDNLWHSIPYKANI